MIHFRLLLLFLLASVLPGLAQNAIQPVTERSMKLIRCLRKFLGLNPPREAAFEYLSLCYQIS
jgi:hypothetical protein